MLGLIGSRWIAAAIGPVAFYPQAQPVIDPIVDPVVDPAFVHIRWLPLSVEACAISGRRVARRMRLCGSRGCG